MGVRLFRQNYVMRKSRMKRHVISFLHRCGRFWDTLVAACDGIIELAFGGCEKTAAGTAERPRG
jgi:hypothetical protein